MIWEIREALLLAKRGSFSLKFSKLFIAPVDFAYGDGFCVHSVEVLRFEPTKVCKPEGRKRPPETGKTTPIVAILNPRLQLFLVSICRHSFVKLL